MAKVTVRLTMFPEPVEVDEEEIPGLRQQGLLVTEEETREELLKARDAAAAEVQRLDAELKSLEPADETPATPEPTKPAAKPAAKNKES